MTTTLCAAIVQFAFALTGADPGAVSPDAYPYAEAHRATEATGKPMVVMVSTDWCQPCQVMKKTILPRVRERGVLRKVAFAVVNPDHDSKLAEDLTGGGPIPQLVMFRKTATGWKRQKLVGGQSVETVEKFINDGLAQDEEEKKSETGTDEKHSTDTDQTDNHAAAAVEG
jgi:thioredoxin-like negative regulator of GroEL